MINEQLPEFQRFSSVLDGTFTEYKLEDPRIYNHGIVSIFDYLKPNIIELIKTHPNTKVYLNLFVTMYQPSSGVYDEQGLRTGALEFLQGTDPETILTALRDIIYGRLAKLENAVGSGWTLVRIEYLTIKFAEYLVTIGSSYKPLPKKIKYSGGVINIQNNDNECFKWAVTRALHPVSKDGGRVTRVLREQAKKYDWLGIKFPTSFKDIGTFEILNKISIMVLGWDEESQHVEYLRIPRTKHTRAIKLFFHDNHYSVITELSIIVNQDTGRHRYHFCSYCPFKHRSEDSLRNHVKDCAINELTQVNMPSEGECVEFKKWEYTLRRPYVICADFECRLEKVEIKKGETPFRPKSIDQLVIVTIWYPTLTPQRMLQFNIQRRPMTRMCLYTSSQV